MENQRASPGVKGHPRQFFAGHMLGCPSTFTSPASAHLRLIFSAATSVYATPVCAIPVCAIPVYANPRLCVESHSVCMQVSTRAASPALSPAGDLGLRRSSSGTPRASLATPNSEPSKGLLRRSDSGGLKSSRGRPLTARPGASPSGASTPRGSPTTSRLAILTSGDTW